METCLKRRTVLITGAGRNIGRRCAVMFAQQGANLAICTSGKDKRVAMSDKNLTIGVIDDDLSARKQGVSDKEF